MLSSQKRSSRKSVHNKRNTKTTAINIPPLKSNPQSPKNLERLFSNFDMIPPPPIRFLFILIYDFIDR